MIGEPVSLPTRREGVELLCGLIARADAPRTAIAIEATGPLHLPAPGQSVDRPAGSSLFAEFAVDPVDPLPPAVELP